MPTERRSLAGPVAGVLAAALAAAVGLGAAGVGAHDRPVPEADRPVPEAGRTAPEAGRTAPPGPAAGAGDLPVAGWVNTHGVRSTVLAAPGASAATAAALLAETDRDVPRVTAAWGSWSERAVVLLPASTAQAAALSGEGAGFADVAAAVVAGRIVIDPAAYGRLTATGRRVVLTHELTHLATAAATTARTPDWLVEGYADTVGYAGSGLSAAAITAELTADVRAGRVPAALPADAAFGAGAGDLAATYEQGWLACRLLAARTPLAPFYRDVGRRGLAAALARADGGSVAAFTGHWRAAVRALGGGPR